MSVITRKVVDVPVAAKWYVIHVEVYDRTKEGKVLVEFKERWQEEIENGKVVPANIPLEENGSTKDFTVIIDTDDDDRYVFDLYVDNIFLEEYMKSYMDRYGGWEIERLGAKSKFVYDKNAGRFSLKGIMIATPERQLDLQAPRQQRLEQQHICSKDRS